jgi:hypothetical protein
LLEEDDGNSNDRNRFRRPAPERREPIRNPGQFVQSDRPYAKAPEWRSEKAGSAQDSVVDEGVRLGYEVIDEYLYQAKSMANRFSPAGSSGLGILKGLPGDLESLADESMTYYRQLMDTWLKMVSSMGQRLLSSNASPDAQNFWGAPDPFAPQEQHSPQPSSGLWQEESTEAAPVSTANVALAVQASRPSQVRFELKAGADPLRMVVHPLRSLQPDADEIREVEFLPVEGQITLRVVVADDLPPGVYSGAIVDSATGSAFGVVSVTVD